MLPINDISYVIKFQRVKAFWLKSVVIFVLHAKLSLYIYICIYLYACMLSHFSCVQLFVTLWTVAHQAPLSMGFSRSEYWSELPCPPPCYLPASGIEPKSPVAPTLQADSLSLSHQGSPCVYIYIYIYIYTWIHIIASRWV